ncbi:MAG: hypothetical protein V3T70_03440, partial [Phycisphaerae bacterium]
MNDKRDELESLISRSGDPTLSPRERRALESALRDHPHLSDSADQYRRLSDLLARRSAAGAAVDWNELRARLRTAIAEDSQRRLTESLDRADHGGEPVGPEFDVTDATTERDRAQFVQLHQLLSRYAEDRPGV